jgi:hypothetical protein
MTTPVPSTSCSREREGEGTSQKPKRRFTGGMSSQVRMATLTRLLINIATAREAREPWRQKEGQQHDGRIEGEEDDHGLLPDRREGGLAGRRGAGREPSREATAEPFDPGLVPQTGGPIDQALPSIRQEPTLKMFARVESHHDYPFIPAVSSLIYTPVFVNPTCWV